MKKYRITTYRTLKGKCELVDIGDHIYGEWIIYENEKPKFHVNLFREDSESDKRIKELIEHKNESIESIIKKINLSFKMELNLGKRPIIEIVVNTKLKELALNPIPTEWLLK